jgi:hypothetical protein
VSGGARLRARTSRCRQGGADAAHRHASSVLVGMILAFVMPFNFCA